MKNRGVIIAIILILIMGAGVTAGTKRFISDKTSGSPMHVLEEQASPSSGQGMESMPVAAAGITTFSADGEAGAEDSGEGTGTKTEAGQTFSAADTKEKDGSQTEGAADRIYYSRSSDTAGETEQTAAAVSEELNQAAAPAAGSSLPGESSAEMKSSVVISPLTGVNESDAVIADNSKTLEGYRKKLSEIDSLVQNMQSAEAGSNTDSLKNVADYEYRLWDTELNRIYQSLLEGLTEEESEALRAEEREWIRTRDLAAKKAAAKYGGGTMESLEYTASLSASTRSRAYELLDSYGDYLEQEED